MYLKCLELSGFKSFAKTTKLEFPASVSAIVGPNGAGKSNVTEAIRWVLGEQSIKSLRGKRGEDLIFNGSQSAPRLGKASVSLIFDNNKKDLPIDYDEVMITRKVFRDGINEYFINNSQVRLKDVIELLSKIGLGSSSHHIIGQGESDRILNASLVERRQMIEGALGLKIYQLKRTESERKLDRTEENMNQVEALRKEIQPHLKFLKKQVDKAEKLSSVKDSLKNYYLEYLSSEAKYLRSEEDKIDIEKNKIEEEILKIKKELSDTPEDSQTVKLKDEIKDYKKEIDDMESEVNDFRSKRNSLERELGRLEGMIEATEIRKSQEGDKSVSVGEVRKFTENIEKYIEEGMSGINLEESKDILNKIKELIKEFLKVLGSKIYIPSSETETLKKKQKEIRDLLSDTEKNEKELLKKDTVLKNKIYEKEQFLHVLEKKKFEMEVRFKELNGILNNLKIREENIKIQKEELNHEIQESKALVGNIVLNAKEGFLKDWEIERNKIRREIERLKIKIEDSGGVGEDVLMEYDDVKKRDEFFEKELIDLQQAIKSLKDLLMELEEKIDHDFKSGIEKINKEFQNFFVAMFGGGKAELRKVVPKKRKKEEELEVPMLAEGEFETPIPEDIGEEGIDVYINLPKKRIHSLDMLSGGERALTSIALLFAMSQVNPPPFLVLDETDAALDEANSQKYAQMLKDLGKHTQLILITHNRETMKQAGVLYGVTMGSDSISKLLSIKFEQAEQYTSTG